LLFSFATLLSDTAAAEIYTLSLYDALPIFFGGIELHDAVPLGILHGVGEDDAALWIGTALQQLGHTGPVEYIVAQNERNLVVSDKVFSQYEGLRKPVRAGLLFIADPATDLRSVSQKLLEIRQILRRGDQQNVADTCQHQGRQRVIDHRLVVHRHQLLGYGKG